MLLRLLEHVIGMLTKHDRPTPKKIERHRSMLLRARGTRFPSGMPCWVSRARPDAFLYLEFDDGSVIEVSPGYGFAAAEMPATYRLSDVIRMAHVIIDIQFERASRHE